MTSNSGTLPGMLNVRTAASGSPQRGFKWEKHNLFTRISDACPVNAVWPLYIKALEWNVFQHASGKQTRGMMEAVGSKGFVYSLKQHFLFLIRIRAGVRASVVRNVKSRARVCVWRFGPQQECCWTWGSIVTTTNFISAVCNCGYIRALGAMRETSNFEPNWIEMRAQSWQVVVLNGILIHYNRDDPRVWVMAINNAQPNKPAGNFETLWVRVVELNVNQ